MRDMRQTNIEDCVRCFTVETGWGDTDAPWEPVDTDETYQRQSWTEYY